MYLDKVRTPKEGRKILSICLIVPCMYVCKKVALRGVPMGSGVPTGPRGGTHRNRRSNIPTPQFQRHRVTHAGTY